MTKKEIWAKIAETRNQRKALMTESKEIRAKIPAAAKEDKKLMREKIKENNAKRAELLVQVKELYAQKAAIKKEAPAAE